MRVLYTLLFYTLLPLALLRMVLRGRKAPAYRQRWDERLSRAPRVAPATGVIWFHCVSVGETLAAVPLIRAAQARWPEVPVLVTTTTPTGSERVTASLGDSVHHVYLPFDLPGMMRRFLNRWQPRVLVVMETELWPNLIAACHRRDIPVMLANARLSERSARGYERVAALTRPMLGQLSLIAAQFEPDARRFVALGAPAERVKVTGSLKFDLHIDPEKAALGRALRQQWQRPVWIAASTHEGEDQPVLESHRHLLATHPDLLLILVPRHPERFNGVADLIQAQGFSCARRSLGETVSPETQVYLGDTMGELLGLFAAADVAFVGGSLAPTGGHNPLEPLAMGVPVVMGAHVFNFQVICDALKQEGALVTVKDGDTLAAAVEQLLTDPQARDAQVQAGQRVLAQNRGALARQLEMLAGLMPTE
ncbi:MAG: 3-deoxy-D-manno-octulosonic acid transferase [Gammaproteobacteria bacterium]|nr:MAG: 3-deoxy-D-manno-octulosonic acid transferase [Gammaproteobacteria bacterium]